MVSRLLAAFALLISGACSAGGGKSDTEIVMIDEVSAPIKVDFGETLIFEATETSGTGYQWFPSFNPDYLTLVETTRSGPASSSDGGAESVRFHFRAAQTGEVDLTFYLARTDDEPVETRTVHLTIN